MPHSFYHFGHFAVRVFVCSYVFLGTSPGGIAAQVISIVATEVKGGWWRRSAWVENWRGGLKRALGTLAIVWAAVIIGCVVNTAYYDHQNLSRRLHAVVNEKDALKAGLTQRDEYIKKLENAKECPKSKTGSANIGAPVPAEDKINNASIKLLMRCALRDQTKMPEDKQVFWPGEHNSSYLEGPIGKAYLDEPTAVSYKRGDDNITASFSQTYVLRLGSSLMGEPSARMREYAATLNIWAADSTDFLACDFVEATFRLNGKDILTHTDRNSHVMAPNTGPMMLRWSLADLKLP